MQKVILLASDNYVLGEKEIDISIEDMYNLEVIWVRYTFYNFCFKHVEFNKYKICKYYTIYE